jgi:hypothetical protein
MRAFLLALAALTIITGAGCRGINLACDSCSCGGHHGHGLAHGGHGGHGANCPGDGHFGHGGGLLGHGTPGFPPQHHHASREYVGPAGPPTAQVGYPYYTIRGPRDFLLDNPPSIGR